MLSWLAGKKTYIVGAAMVVVAGLRHLDYIDDATFRLIEGLLTGTGLVTLRAGIARAAGGGVAKVLLIGALVIATAAACSSGSYLKTVSTSGTMLVAVSQAYVATGDTFKAMCARGVIKALDCDAWRMAATAFKPAYAAAATAWRAAANEEDARAAAIAIVGLSNELTRFALLAAQASAQGGK